MSEGKDALRERFKALRKGLASPEADEKIAAFASERFGAYRSFFVYLSFGTEVPTKKLIDALSARGTVCVPRIAEGKMYSVPLCGELQKTAFGFLQPPGGEERTCEVAFVPLLAADKLGHRLGYGGGFYDGYFARHPDVLRVGLGYFGQLTGRLPSFPWDMPLHALVTERGICRFPLGEGNVQKEEDHVE